MSVCAQSPQVLHLSTEEELSCKLDTFIGKDFYINPNETLKIVFRLKVDSTGEVYSAHVVWSNNLKFDKYYDIYTVCHRIESVYRVKFIYDRYKDEFLNKKYVICDFPYFSNRIHTCSKR